MQQAYESQFLLNSMMNGSVKRKIRSTEWEISKSSFSKIRTNPTYDECREYACKDISTKTQIREPGKISEIKRGSRFNFLVRVDTNFKGLNNPKQYYEQFVQREDLSGIREAYEACLVNRDRDVSHYGLGGGILFAYNIEPNLISHIFPMDCDSDQEAAREEEITEYPSLWLTLTELNAATLRLRTYNQITCRTKTDDGKIIKPARIIAIDSINPTILAVAEAFGIGCTVVHPNQGAICEKYDPFLSFGGAETQRKRKELFKELKKMYSLEEIERFEL